jgi:hypothetical protein
MPTSPTDLIVVSDGSWTDFDSLEDAIDQIKQYRQNELDLLNSTITSVSSPKSGDGW